jgi:hypothetical protein
MEKRYKVPVEEECPFRGRIWSLPDELYFFREGQSMVVQEHAEANACVRVRSRKDVSDLETNSPHIPARYLAAKSAVNCATTSTRTAAIVTWVSPGKGEVSANYVASTETRLYIAAHRIHIRGLPLRLQDVRLDSHGHSSTLDIDG